MTSKNSTGKKPIAEDVEQTKVDLRQEEGFTVTYADHVALIQTGFDLKVIFGRMDPSVGPYVVLQHSAVVLPWPTVKTLIYLLQASLLTYEETNGHIPYPKGGLLAPPASVPEEISKLFPNAKETHQKLLKLWEKFLIENPEARS